MGELDERLSSILSSPEDMKKIMELAKSLSAARSDSAAPPSGGGEGDAGASSPFGDIDPGIIKLINRVMGEFSSSKNDKALILGSIKPYLRADRQEKIDKAVKIARMARIAKTAISEFDGGGLNF